MTNGEKEVKQRRSLHEDEIFKPGSNNKVARKCKRRFQRALTMFQESTGFNPLKPVFQKTYGSKSFRTKDEINRPKRSVIKNSALKNETVSLHKDTASDGNKIKFQEKKLSKKEKSKAENKNKEKMFESEPRTKSKGEIAMEKRKLRNSFRSTTSEDAFSFKFGKTNESRALSIADSIKIDIPTQQSSSSDESANHASNTQRLNANSKTEDNYQSELDDLEELTMMDIINPSLKQAIDSLCKTTVTIKTEKLESISVNKEENMDSKFDNNESKLPLYDNNEKDETANELSKGVNKEENMDSKLDDNESNLPLFENNEKDKTANGIEKLNNKPNTESQLENSKHGVKNCEIKSDLEEFIENTTAKVKQDAVTEANNLLISCNKNSLNGFQNIIEDKTELQESETELESLQDKGDEYKEISFANTTAEEPSLQAKEVDTELTNENMVKEESLSTDSVKKDSLNKLQCADDIIRPQNKLIKSISDSESEPEVNKNHINSESYVDNWKADKIETVESFVELLEDIEDKKPESNKETDIKVSENKKEETQNDVTKAEKNTELSTNSSDTASDENEKSEHLEIVDCNVGDGNPDEQVGEPADNISINASQQPANEAAQQQEQRAQQATQTETRELDSREEKKETAAAMGEFVDESFKLLDSSSVSSDSVCVEKVEETKQEMHVKLGWREMSVQQRRRVLSKVWTKYKDCISDDDSVISDSEMSDCSDIDEDWLNDGIDTDDSCISSIDLRSYKSTKKRKFSVPKTTVIEKPELEKTVENIPAKFENIKAVEAKPAVKAQEKPAVTKKPANVSVSNGILVKKGQNGIKSSNGAKQPVSVKVVEQQDVVVKESFVANDDNSAVATQRKKVARISHATRAANPANQVKEKTPAVANDNAKPQEPVANDDSVVTESAPKVNSIRSMWERKKAGKWSGFDANRDAAFDGEAKGRLKGAKALFENLATPKLQRRATTKDTSRTLPRSFNQNKPKRRPMSSVFDVTMNVFDQQNLANQESVSSINLSCGKIADKPVEVEKELKNGGEKVEGEKAPVAKPRSSEVVKVSEQEVAVNESTDLSELKPEQDNPPANEPEKVETLETVKSVAPAKPSKAARKSGPLKKKFSKNSKKSTSTENDDYDGNFSDESGLSDVSSLSSGSDDDLLSD